MSPIIRQKHLMRIKCLSNLKPLFVMLIVLFEMMDSTMTIRPILPKMCRKMDSVFVQSIPVFTEEWNGIGIFVWREIVAFDRVELEPVDVESNFIATV